MNELKIIDKQEFMGREIQVLEGGFGENQRIITAKEVANIHEVELKTINQSIKRLIDKNRIKVGVHYIDLLSNENFKVTASDLGLITSNGQKNCFVLSERGYASLIKYMDDDESWDVMDKLIDEYFRMREVIKSDEQLLAQLCLQLYRGGQDAVMASQKITEIEVSKATKPLLVEIDSKNKTIQQQEDEIQIKKDIITGFTEDIDILTKRNIVNRIIKRSPNGGYSGRYKEMYKCFKETFSIDLEARCKGYNLKQAKKKDQLSVIKYAEQFGYMDKLYEVACKLYHSEVQQILKELGKIVD